MLCANIHFSIKSKKLLPVSEEMDDLEYLNRLKESQQQFLEENQKTQDTRKKLINDYKRLKERLKTLPDTVSQPTMVPVGDVAFFPGTIIHTNEIMVLIGNNWFVERSAKQASEIVDRRIQLVTCQLEELGKEYNHIKSNLDYTAHFEQIKESGDMKEIKEDLPTDYENTKDKKRIAHKAKHNKIPKTITFKSNEELVEHIKENLPADENDDEQRTIDHEELMLRLNELEREEQEAEAREHENVLQSLRDGSYKVVNGKKQDVPPDKDGNGGAQERHVKFEDVPPETMSGFERTNLYGVHFDECDNVIRFEHTDSNLQRERSVSESDLRNFNYQFNSPADIYDHFSRTDSEDKPKIKSILKKDSRSGSTENLKLRPILKTSPEHRPGTPENTLDEPQSILKTPPDTQASEKRPGTPENTLDGGVTHSILKINNERENIYFDSDAIDDTCPESQVRPILKGPDTVPYVRTRSPKITELFSSNPNEDTKSILKNSDQPSSSLSNRTFCPEVLFETSSSSSAPAAANCEINDARKSILTSPDSAVRLKGSTVRTSMDANMEPKPILKNVQDNRKDISDHPSRKEAFSGIIVERNTSLSHGTETSNSTTNKKPISKFKASRMKK